VACVILRQKRTSKYEGNMPPPKSKESKQPLPNLNDCSEVVLVSAIIGKLSQDGDRPVRIGSSDVSKVLEVVRKHAAAARRDKTMSLVAFDMGINEAG
jgi:hypothetical protein